MSRGAGQEQKACCTAHNIMPAKTALLQSYLILTLNYLACSEDPISAVTQSRDLEAGISKQESQSRTTNTLLHVETEPGCQHLCLTRDHTHLVVQLQALQVCTSTLPA